MKTKFNILMACRDGVIHFFLLFHLRLSTFSRVALVFVIQEVPITKPYAQEPQQTPMLTFGVKLSSDLWRFYSWPLIHKCSKYNKNYTKFAKNEQKKPKNNAYLNVCSQLWCRLHLQERGKTNHQILHLFLLCGVLNLLCLFSLFYFPRWRTIEPNLLRSFVLSRENMSWFLPESSVLLKYVCYFTVCGMCDSKGWTQVSAHRSANTDKRLLNIPVFLSPQLTHCPITGCGKILITRLCCETMTTKPVTYSQ